MLPHIYKVNGTLSVALPDGVMKQIDTAHKNYKEIIIAMKAGEDAKVIELINIADQIERAIRASSNTDNVKIVDGEVLFQGEPIHTSLTTRMITMADEGFDIGHLVLFLENLMKNPSYRAVNELYNFLEAGAIPITENGTFLTYKKIRGDYTDVYTGKFDNSIGTTVSMPRNHVNEDSSQTCSAGLHVCSYNYLPSFGSSPGNRVVICEISPEFVVSIPDDYNNTKMRVCSYTVIGEVEDYKEEDILGNNSVMLTEDVPQPIPEASDDEIKAHGKAIGKMVSNQLDNEEITRQNIIDALIRLDMADNQAEEICDGDNKQVGKAISRAIRGRIISPFPFEDSLMEMKAEDVEDSCAECGNETDNTSGVCDDCESIDDEGSCPRCGAEMTFLDEYCDGCGYYR